MDIPKEVKYVVDVMIFSIHTNFNMFENTEMGRIFEVHLSHIDGINTFELHRYSLAVSVGYMFDIHTVKARVFEHLTNMYGVTKFTTISQKEIADRALQAQLAQDTPISVESVSAALVSMLNAGGIKEA